MRSISRFLLAAALTVTPVGIAMVSCSTGAAGVAACIAIEDARCQLAPKCTPGFDVDRCTRFYRDNCLNGIQNTTNSVDPDTLAQGCVTALQLAGTCVDNGGANSDCPGLALVPDASCTEVSSLDPTACNVILACPEVIAACNFVQTPIDAGIDATDADAATTDASDDGDASSDGDAAPE